VSGARVPRRFRGTEASGSGSGRISGAQRPQTTIVIIADVFNAVIVDWRRLGAEKPAGTPGGHPSSRDRRPVQRTSTGGASRQTPAVWLRPSALTRAGRSANAAPAVRWAEPLDAPPPLRRGGRSRQPWLPRGPRYRKGRILLLPPAPRRS
jgi:hypothetical protein